MLIWNTTQIYSIAVYLYLLW